jgi:hypothetical protein
VSEDEELIDLDEANVPLTNGVTNGNGHVNGAISDAGSNDSQSTTDSQTAAAAQELFNNWDGVWANPSVNGDEPVVALTNGNTNGHTNGNVNGAASSNSQSTNESQTAAQVQELFDNWDGQWANLEDNEAEQQMLDDDDETNGHPMTNGHDEAEAELQAVVEE